MSSPPGSVTHDNVSAGDEVTTSLTARLVPIDKVARDPAQPRRDWRYDNGQQRLDELTSSIKEFGILQPLLVHDAGDHFVVIAGGRRLVAAKRAGLTEVPVVVRNAEGARRRILQLLENLQRADLSPTDEGRAYQELMDLEGLTPPKIALQVRRSEQHVRDRLRLASDQVLADAVERRQISASVARQIQQTEPLDYAAQLRRRVQAGEKLQQHDIDAARAQMKRDGVTNPRLSRGVPIATLLEKYSLDSPLVRTPHEPLDTGVELSEERAPAPADEAVSWLEPDQSRTARTEEEAWAHLQEGYRRYRGSMTRSEPTALPSRQPLPAADRDRVPPKAGAASAPVHLHSPDDEAATLSHLLAEGDRTWLMRVLTYGTERGFTCAGLLQQVRVAS